MDWTFKLLSPKNHLLSPSVSSVLKLIFLSISVFGSELGVRWAGQDQKFQSMECVTHQRMFCRGPAVFEVKQAPSCWLQLWVVYTDGC